METSVKQRLMQFIKEKGISQRRFEESAGLSNGYINSLRHAPGVDKMKRILDTYPELNRTWVLTGEGSMINGEKEQPKAEISTTKGVPYFNVDFKMGFDIMVNDQTVNPDYYINFTPYNNCDCWINARGDSMAPTISPGDMVALQRIEDFRYLISGEVYAIVTANGLRTIKRINDHGSTLELVPDNQRYESQTIDKSEITAVFYVRGCVKAL